MENHTVELKVFLDGDDWCALIGDNLQDGLGGFGESINEAMEALMEQLPADEDELVGFLKRWSK